MKSWKEIIAGLLLIALLISEGTVSAQQLKLTAKQQDAMAQTLADADQNRLIGVSDTGWVYYLDSDFRTVRKRYLDGSQDQLATSEKLLYFTPLNIFVPRDNRNMNVLSIRDDQPFLNKLYDHPEQYHFFFQLDKSIVYWEGTEKEEVKWAGKTTITYSKGSINVANLDGSGAKTLFKDNGNLDYYSMAIYNGYLYYVLLNEDRYGGELFRVDLNGQGTTKITDDYLSGVESNADNVPGGLRFVAMIGKRYDPGLIINNTLFYHSTDHSFYRINIDGTKKIKLSGNTAGNIIDGGWMYYSTPLDSKSDTLTFNGPIYKVKLGGGKPIQLTGEMTTFLTAKDGWIYYTYEAKSGQTVLERKKADGSGLKQRVMSEQFNPLLGDKLVGDWFVYTRSDGLFRVKLDGSQKAAVELYPKERR
ncbi:hypothetical protein J4772_35715 [Cohnella sp. LGH]|uniref:DUF5050 domain-containing protein n=1 Tax=Cohnella sp. LGH TaxID=1619153 RepID=UPI001ADA5553|nr:DUF5050 domain-containing protein [Cohnella sp. LGH]QTH42742.1 hypothetical protein J4772_35715 [Cohnella sp. LGH]